MLKVGDLVEVDVNDKNSGKRGIVVEFLSSDTVTVYIGTVGYRYHTAFLRKVECSE